MQLMPVGVDSAKQVFQVHHVDSGTGEIVNKAIKRAGFVQYFVNRAPCLIGMEACGGAQHWARELTQARASGQAHAGAVRQGVQHRQQERCSRRPSDLARSAAARQSGRGQE